MLSYSCKFTTLVSGIKSTDGQTAEPVTFSFFTQFRPFWVNPDTVMMDLRALLGTIPDEVIYAYIYEASVDAWRGIKGGIDRWASRRSDMSGVGYGSEPPFSPYVLPNYGMSLDQLLVAGASPEMVEQIEAYVRYRAEYLLITGQFPYLATMGSGEKVLGDFRISYRGNISDLKAALDVVIIPEMEEAFFNLTGEMKTKASPRVVIRGSTEQAKHRAKAARRHMPPGIGAGRNWDRW